MNDKGMVFGTALCFKDGCTGMVLVCISTESINGFCWHGDKLSCFKGLCGFEDGVSVRARKNGDHGVLWFKVVFYHGAIPKIVAA